MYATNKPEFRATTELGKDKQRSTVAVSLQSAGNGSDSHDVLNVSSVTGGRLRYPSEDSSPALKRAGRQDEIPHSTSALSRFAQRAENVMRLRRGSWTPHSTPSQRAGPGSRPNGPIPTRGGNGHLQVAERGSEVLRKLVWQPCIETGCLEYFVKFQRC
jgi:hypothetical protein